MAGTEGPRKFKEIKNVPRRVLEPASDHLWPVALAATLLAPVAGRHGPQWSIADRVTLRLLRHLPPTSSFHSYSTAVV